MNTTCLKCFNDQGYQKLVRFFQVIDRQLYSVTACPRCGDFKIYRKGKKND